MFSELSAAEISSSAPATIEPLDPERFEDLSTDEVEKLLASRFCSFVERGWSWKSALLLAVRPDSPALPLTLPGDAGLW